VAEKRSSHVNYPDWVHIVLDRDLVLLPGAVFSGSNAARDSGVHLGEGADNLLKLWADPSVPSGWRRNPRHLASVPTDLQAEVLIPGPVPIDAVRAVVVGSVESAREQYAILLRLGIECGAIEWLVAPAFYDKHELTRLIHAGKRPAETVWIPETEDSL
jgi:hypothetical protein